VKGELSELFALYHPLDVLKECLPIVAFGLVDLMAHGQRLVVVQVQLQTMKVECHGSAG
jgi:hypothetical protein